MAATAQALPPLAYQKAHYNDDQRDGVYGSAVVFIVVVIATTVLRFVVRRQRKAPLKADDWIMVAAVEVIVFSVFYNFAGGLIRASILMLYLRIFPDWRFKVKVWVVQAVQSAYSTMVTAAIGAQCVPIKAIWDKTVKGRCLNMDALVIGTAGINIFMDLSVFLLPLPILLGLKVSLTRKLALCMIFAMGSGVCVVSVVRAFYSRDYRNPDATWNLTLLGTLSMIEVMGGIFCGNASVIYPLFAKPISAWTASLPVSSFARFSRARGDADEKTVHERHPLPQSEQRQMWKNPDLLRDAELGVIDDDEDTLARANSDPQKEGLNSISSAKRNDSESS